MDCRPGDGGYGGSGGGVNGATSASPPLNSCLNEALASSARGSAAAALDKAAAAAGPEEGGSNGDAMRTKKSGDGRRLARIPYAKVPLLLLLAGSFVLIRKASVIKFVAYHYHVNETHALSPKDRPGNGQRNNRPGHITSTVSIASEGGAKARPRDVPLKVQARKARNKKKKAKRGGHSLEEDDNAAHELLGTATRKEKRAETKAARRPEPEPLGHFSYHDRAVLLVHYHKTGYVLSRELRKLVRDLELSVHRPDEPSRRGADPRFEISGVDDATGERYAFDHVGNWARSAFPARRHAEPGGKGKADRGDEGRATGCPRPWRAGKVKGGFDLRGGTIYVQESPDFFCDEEDMLKSLAKVGGGTKIVHFVRNSFDMALSNYFYHSQDPTPEPWVHEDDPCQSLYQNGESLSSHVMPTLASWANATSGAPDVTQRQMDDIVELCRSLYRSKGPLEQATFYQHLTNLSKSDGLRLATAQMTVASGWGNGHLAGGDVLRMANNVILFEKLKNAPGSNVQLMTVALGDFIGDAANSTMRFLDFVFGSDRDAIGEERLRKGALRQEEKYDRKGDGKHVTQTNPEDKKDKKALRHMLKMDERLGPILNLTEILVNKALASSE
ncbi:hypothetical protein ACHAWF_006952 [Thalassiosira exigua]